MIVRMKEKEKLIEPKNWKEFQDLVDCCYWLYRDNSESIGSTQSVLLSKDAQKQNQHDPEMNLRNSTNMRIWERNTSINEWIMSSILERYPILSSKQSEKIAKVGVSEERERESVHAIKNCIKKQRQGFGLFWMKSKYNKFVALEVQTVNQGFQKKKEKKEQEKTFPLFFDFLWNPF